MASENCKSTHINARERKLLKSFNGCLRDFKSDEDAFENSSAWDGTAVKIVRSKLPLPYMVFLCFVGLKGYEHWGRDEKLAWSIPFTYKSYPLMFSYRKFGLELLRRTGDEPPDHLVEHMLRQLGKAFRIIDGLMQPFAESQIASGNVTVANSYHKLDMMYWFFRKKARASFSRPLPKPPPHFLRPKWSEKSKSRTWDPDRGEREGFYYTVAMLDAFFSRLEHLLILLLPFVDFDPKQNNLADIMMSKWSDKFKHVFRLDTDSTARLLYEELSATKRKYRNSVIHGDFEKNPVSLYFHLPRVGAIPVGLSTFKDSIHYSFFPVTPESSKEMCTLFDKTDKFLRTGCTKYGMMYVEAGLDVAFDDPSISRYHSAMKSGGHFAALIEADSNADMIRTNMDW